MSKSAWTEKDQIDNFLKERRPNEGSTSELFTNSVEVFSYEVSVSAEGVEELKRKVKIKDEKKEALLTLSDAMHNPLKFDESDTHVLERFDTSAGNPVKEILLKLNLPDHRKLKDGGVPDSS
ncbi:hypothetical protein Tco_1046180 [Tanacetum coccineum]